MTHEGGDLVQGRSSRFRFLRSRRVRKRRDFVRIQESARAVRTPHLLLLALPRVDGGSGARLGLVASRKVGSAVRRNRGKRIVRELFRLHPDVFPGDADFVVILRPGAASRSTGELLGELQAVQPALKRTLSAVQRPPRSPSDPSTHPGTAPQPTGDHLSRAPGTERSLSERGNTEGDGRAGRPTK